MSGSGVAVGRAIAPPTIIGQVLQEGFEREFHPLITAAYINGT